ncbi:MAG: hypothetical protein RL223_4291 [Pseudomonadota bacterium]
MCLAAWRCAPHTGLPWGLVSNRDEFHDRPAAPLAWWTDGPGGRGWLGGRDLQAGGTWLGLDPRGRLALLTNVREPAPPRADAVSRGDLVLQALRHGLDDGHWMAAELRRPRHGWNLLQLDLAGTAGRWWSNRPQPTLRVLGAGTHGLSNAALDTPWPKVRRLCRALNTACAEAQALPLDGGPGPGRRAAPSPRIERLFAHLWAALADRWQPPDAQLPHTGVPWPLEQALAPVFIHRPATPGRAAYGTRSSTVLVVEQRGARPWLHLRERRFDAAGQPCGGAAWDGPLRVD